MTVLAELWPFLLVATTGFTLLGWSIHRDMRTTARCHQCGGVNEPLHYLGGDCWACRDCCWACRARDRVS